MADRRYFILRNRVEAKLAKPRAIILHVGVFAAYTLVFGGMSLLTRTSGTMDGIFYWTIFGWSVLVGLHTAHTYTRSGAWAATRERLIQTEILEASIGLDLSEADMIEMHQRLSQEISANAAPFRQLALLAARYLLIWPGSLILLFILQRLINYNNLNGDSVFDSLLTLWQPFSLILTLIVTLQFLPWQQLLQQGKSDEDLHGVYATEKIKRHTDAETRLSENAFATDDDDENGADAQVYPQQSITQS
jgi:hypothetical protein